MDKRRVICKLWLALGFVQMMLLVSGCNSGASTSADDLFSNEPANQTQSTGGTDATVAASRSLGTAKPVRLSRAFFERSLAGTVTTPSDEISSNVSWIEHTPTTPAPTGPVIADVRDHKGCAVYDSAGLQLCFNIMPDVSSVGLNADTLSVAGVCDENPSGIKFLKAENNGNLVTVSFQVDCGNQQPSQNISFQLRQI